MPRVADDNRNLAITVRMTVGLAVGLAAVLVPQAAVLGADPAPAASGEPKITVPGAEGDYLRTLHTRIHYRFAVKFIEGVAAKQPPSDPLNKPSLRAEIHFGVRWDGSVSDAVVDGKSGVEAFDKAALAA